MGTEKSKQDVVVTGMGIVSPIGMTVSSFSEAMFKGLSGIHSIRGSLVSPTFPIPYAGYLERSKIKEKTDFAGSLSDSSRMALLATMEAALDLDESSKVDAIVYGSAEGIAFDFVQRSLSSGATEEMLSQSLAEAPLLAMQKWLSQEKKISISDDLLICINSACASGNQAIGDAMQRIRTGEWTRAIVGGVDSRCTASNLMNFHMLGALCSEDVAPEKASRPFSKDRAGFVRSEGAATLVLETRAAAEARGAKIYGVISGYSMTSDAYRLTDGRDDVHCVKQAMLDAIADGGLKASDIQGISAHGTSTPLNDKLETRAIKAVFPDEGRNVPITSLKSQIGHSTVAAGAIEAIACLLMLETQTLAPTINFTPGDEECDLDYVPDHSRPHVMKHMLSNNFGFGGQNTCLVISHP
jgi:3-oxoacyl-[acyl-carrier-protein] synthase II